jgi:hypothetical protein
LVDLTGGVPLDKAQEQHGATLDQPTSRHSPPDIPQRLIPLDTARLFLGRNIGSSLRTDS